MSDIDDTDDFNDPFCVETDQPVEVDQPSGDESLIGFDGHSAPTAVDYLFDDGVNDTIVATGPTGQLTLLSDTDGDSAFDVYLLDLNGDGWPDLRVKRDGASYVVTVDQDGSGNFEEGESYTCTAEELDGMVPGAVDLLNATVETGTQDAAPNPAAVDDASSEDLLRDPDLRPDELGQIGDESTYSEHWFMQSADGHCVPASVAGIVSVYTGQDFTDESAFVTLAQENGLFADGNPSSGMTADDAATLLSSCGVPAAVEQADIEALAEAVDDKRGVMVFIDSGEYWDPAGEATEDNAIDHCVVVSEIDLIRGVVKLSDPGHPDGDAMEVSLDQFEGAWADGDNQMIVCDQPAPASVESPPDEGADGGGPRESDQNVAELSGEELMHDPLKVAIEEVTKSKWILLPVVLSATAAGTAAFSGRAKSSSGTPAS